MMGTKTYNNYQDLITFSRASAGYALRPVSYGSELVTNGDGSSVTNWGSPRNNSTLSVNGGRLRSTASASGAYGMVQTLSNLTVGAIYFYSANVYADGGSGSMVFRVSALSSLDNQPVSDEQSNTRLVSGSFVATASTMYVGGIHVASSAGDYIELDNVSIKEVTFDEVGGRLTLFEHPDNIPRIEYALNDSKDRFASIDDQILKAAVGTEPQATEFDVLVNGQKIGDITNNGDVSAFDASQYLGWLSGSLTNQTYIDYIEDVLNPYIEANLDKYILPYPEGVDRRGLLIEGAKTNLIANSDFDAGVSQSAVTITPRASESPDGLQNATSLDITSSGGFAYFTVSVTAGTEYTWSWFAKLGTATAHVYAVYDVTNAAFVSRAQYTLTNGENYGRGWYRHSETFTAPTGCTEVRVYAVRATDNSGGVAGAQGTTFVWGGQLEAAGFASSIVRTTGNTALRSTDLADMSFSQFGHNKKEITIVADFDYSNWQYSTTYSRAVSLGRSTTSTNANFGFFNNGANAGTIRYRVDNSSGTAVFAAGDLTDSDDYTSVKVALAVKEGQHAITYNGNTPNTSTGGDPELETVDILAIGARWAESPQQAADYMNGHIKSIQIYPRRLTDAQLQEITS